MTRIVSGAEEARLGQLDRVLDTQEPVSTLADEFFSIVDALDQHPAVRRALSDPAAEPDKRKGLAWQLFNGKTSGAALYVLEQAVALDWGSGARLADALERQGVRAELRAAQQNGQLDNVEDELFHFDRAVAGDAGLQAAISNRLTPVAERAGLVTRLLDGKAHEATVVLARRAVAGRDRNFAKTIEGYLALVAQLRNRGMATVTVARPLSDDQANRLRTALSRQVGRDIDIHVIVDPAVVGGVKIELGDEVIDGTVSGRLDSVRRAFGH